MKIITILLASEPTLVVCFLKRNCFNCETLELHRRNEVSRRYALHSVRYAWRRLITQLTKGFFFSVQWAKQKLSWKERNILKKLFYDTKVQHKGKIEIPFNLREFNYILGRTYQIISCSRIIRYVLECHLLDWLWVKISITLSFTFFESRFSQWINTFCCKRVHVIIWKSCGIRSLERGEEGNLNKTLKDFKTLSQISIISIFTNGLLC